MERLRTLLPAKVREKPIAYFALAALWPFVPATMAVALLELMDQARPGMLTWGQYVSVVASSAVASGLGAAVILLALPIRYWVRIAVSMSGGVLAFCGFGLWLFFVIELLDLLHIG